MLSSQEAAQAQALQLAQGRVTSHGGVQIAFPVDTLCIHGDTPGAALMAKAVREALESAGVDVTNLAMSNGS